MSTKHSNKGLLIALLVAVILVSGCTTSGGIATGPGIQITAFEPDINFIESFDNIRLRFNIQNIGGEDARDVLVRLLGVNPAEWSIPSPELDIPDLVAANPAFGTSGGEFSNFFDLIAPPLPEGQTVTYNPILRVHYKYRTSVTKQITLVTEDELRILQQEGRALPSGQTVTSGGPLSVQAITGNMIRSTVQGFGGAKEFPITIRVDNTGAGTVARHPWIPMFPDDGFILLTITLPPGLQFKTLECSDYLGGKPVLLFRGRDAEITCEVVVVIEPIASEERTIIMSFEYDYYIDKTTTLTVKGTEDSGLFGGGF